MVDSKLSGDVSSLPVEQRISIASSAYFSAELLDLLDEVWRYGDEDE